MADIIILEIQVCNKQTLLPPDLYIALKDGEGEISEISRPLKEGEIAEWILLDGVCFLYRLSVEHSAFTLCCLLQTPATCANIGLHNLYHEDIDLLVSERSHM